MSKLKGVTSHHEREIAELRADRELTVEYLKAAMESLDNPDDRAAGLLALRTVTEAYAGRHRLHPQAPRTMSSLTTEFASLLSAIDRPGDFFVAGTTRFLPPLLEVAGVGPIALVRRETGKE